MNEHQRYDMNETVKDVLMEYARQTPYLTDIKSALDRAATVARERTPADPRTGDLLAQTLAQMPTELLSATPVHVARQEFYASPTIIAYAFIADACESWFGADPANHPENNNALETYEKLPTHDHTDDSYLLETAAEIASDEIENARDRA